MTLILTAACPLYVVQVADRLVTRGSDPFDPVANKTVVYRARDALVSIGYSGLAQIGTVPTDEWIVEQLCGAPIHRGHDGIRPAALSLGGGSKNYKLRHACHILRQAVANLPTTHGHGLFLTIAGWEADRRGGERAVVIEIERPGNPSCVAILSSPRYWQRGREFIVHSIGATTSPQELWMRFGPFRGPQGLRCNFAQTENILTGFVRDVAQRQTNVGAHVLSVVLPRPSLGLSHCRFLPTIPHQAKISFAGRVSVTDVTHSPWIISPNMVLAPAITVGTDELNLNGIPFVIHGTSTTSASGLLGLRASLKRPIFR
jgi:hypothetical protein